MWPKTIIFLPNAFDLILDGIIYCMKTIEMKIGGMHCGACATGIQMLVSGMDGVKEAFVDYEKKSAKFTFDEGKVSQEAIVKGISELGYTAS